MEIKTPSEINTPDYKGSCRRNGNSKVNLTGGDWIKIGVIIAGIISSTAVANYRVGLNAQAIADDSVERKEKIEKVEDKNITQDEDILLIKQDVKYIKDDVKEINNEQKEFRKEQQEWREENNKALLEILQEIKK